MTRENAIRELKIFSGTTRIRLSANFWEALNMAIKALEQEPCEDCISRKKIEKLKKWRFSYDTDTTIPKSDLFVKLTDIRDLPPVTPTRKKGKWIRVDHNKVKCSKCEITHLIAQYPHGAIDFCPNCGAEMESE